MSKLNHIDLFAGCGGLSLGFSYEGWSGLFAVEKDPMAYETLSKNLICEDAPYKHFTDWPEWLPKTHHNIKELLLSSEMREKLSGLRGKVDLVAGGPPCQGFSVGGARRANDERNELVFEMLDFVDITQPKMVLIENVEGMARAFKNSPTNEERSVLEIVLSRLKDMGYKASFFVAKALDAGVPQDRKRVITFAIRNELYAGNLPGELLEAAYKKCCVEQRKELELPLDRPTNIGEAIHDLSGTNTCVCPDSTKFMTSKYEVAKSTYAKLMRRGIAVGEIPNSHRFSQHGPKVLTLYKNMHSSLPAGRVPAKFLLENKTKTQKKFLLGENIYASTLTTHPDEHIHYRHPRNVTLREMARLQSFPDDFKFYGRYTLNGERRKIDVSRCAQIGNAVPPLMAKALSRAIRRVYEACLSENYHKELREIAVQSNDNPALFL